MAPMAMAPVAPLFASSASAARKPGASVIGSSRSAPAKKLGVSRKAAPAAADASAFGDFDFEEDGETKDGDANGGGSNGHAGRQGTADIGDNGDEWGWAGTSPQKAGPPPKPAEDDPWADPLKPVGSSMFSYECASLHAPSAPPAPAPAPTKPKAPRSLSSAFEGDDPPPLEPTPAPADPYGSAARDRFGSAMAISSDSFMANPKQGAQAAAPAARDPAEEAAEQQRRLDRLWGAQGFGSSDLESDPSSNSPSRATRLAESTKAIGGAAIGMAASLLTRATSKTG
jgi:hypothetical protein